MWSPTSDRIAFTSAVYPDCTNDACNAAKAKAASDNKVKAHVADQLMYRHWNAWDEGTRSHLFVVGVDGSAPKDLMPGAKYDVPPGPFGGSEGYAWSPDGRELAYTAKDQGRADAWTTDVNLYTVPASGGAPTVITAANKGADQNPVYSPDGRFIALRVAGARRLRVGSVALDALQSRRQDDRASCCPTWDRNADAYFWSPDMSAFYVQTTDAGARQAVSRRARRGAARSRRSTPQLVDRRSQQHGVLPLARRTHASPGCATRRSLPPRCDVAELTASSAASAHAR